MTGYEPKCYTRKMTMIEPGQPIFRLFHRYNKLVRRGLVKPLACKTCSSLLTTALGDNDELVLKCFVCDSSTVPGLATISDVRAVVTEHFEDE